MISLQNLSFKYKPTEDLFYKLNLEIKTGTICGLLGKNGTGKTTLLRLIAGLLFPQQQGKCKESGESNCKVKVLDCTPSHRTPQFLQEIYFLPEEFYLPGVTAHTYVNIFSPFYPKFNRDELLHFLQEFDLPYTKKLTTLSYGQKKKFLVAFALATNCKLLLLDEPTNGLDIPSKGQFRRLLAASLTEQKTIIIATHQVRDLQNLLDTVVILDDGKIAFNQSLQDVANRLSFVQQPLLLGEESVAHVSMRDEQQCSAPAANAAVTRNTENPAAETGIASVIYAEKILGGFMTVKVKAPQQQTFTEDTEEEIDLEVLFNAVLAKRDRINAVFCR